MVNSSLTYEILVYLNSFYFGLFAACETGMGVLKAVNLAYPPGALGVEAGLLTAFLVVETLRLVLGRRGNLQGRSAPVVASVALTVPSALGVAYLLLLQTHRLRLEYILCALMLALQAAELFFALLFVVSLCRPPSYD